MKATISPLGGVCILHIDADAICAYDITNGPKKIEEDVLYRFYTCCDDWEQIEADCSDDLVQEALKRHELQRAVQNIEVSLTPLGLPLKAELMTEVEEFIKARGSVLLKRLLLRAPLKSIDNLHILIEICLEQALAACAQLLESVKDLQPELRRLANLWLQLPRNLFTPFDGGPQEVWRAAAEQGIIIESLNAEDEASFKAQWGRLAVSFKSPAKRIAIAQLQSAITTSRFPAFDQSRTFDINIDKARSAGPHGNSKPVQKPMYAEDALRRALSQIEAIATAVESGHDAKANKFLRELISSQLSSDRGNEYAVKSLCNIAQQCAAMYRTDFEFQCLEAALKIDRSDGWTLVQLADHYKRKGLYKEALEALDEAAALGQSDVAQSAKADVHTMMGQYEHALSLYRQIPGGEQNETMRTAQADVLRRAGRLDEAEREYDRIVRDGLGSHRVEAGKAEIAKRRGDLDAAHEIYRRLLEVGDSDESARFIYRMAVTNVLLRMGCYEEAYRHADAAVQSRPFSRQARAVRAAVVGLLGRVDQALVDVPMVGQANAFNEWVNDFIRGVLLLTLDRYSDARESLLRRVESAYTDQAGQVLLGLGAVVCLLRQRSTLKDAQSVLDRMPGLNDAFAEWIRTALSYHVAIGMNDSARIQQVESELDQIKDAQVSRLVVAIKTRSWGEAVKLEAQAILRLAS